MIDFIHHLDAALVTDIDLTHIAIGLAHHDHGQVLAIGNINADLSAADTDGSDRRVDNHGVGVGFRHLAADDCENALEGNQRQRSFLGAGIIDHFVQNHTAVATHGQGGLVGHNHADGAVGTGFQDIPRIKRCVDIQFDPGSVHTDNKGLACDRVNGADGLRVGVGSSRNALPGR